MDDMVNELCDRLRTHRRVLHDLQARGQRQDSAPLVQVARRIQQCEGWLGALGARALVNELRDSVPTAIHPHSNAA